MKTIWVISENTFLEIIRSKILYGLGVFAVLLMGFSLALGQLSFAEQARIAMDFGLSSIQLSAVVMSIFIGSTLVSREIEKQTIYTLLVKPISRSQFLLGKYFGLGLVNLTVILSLTLILTLIFFLFQMPVHLSLFICLLGILMESFVILGFSLLFSCFSTPFMVVIFSSSLWLIGNWMESLKYFASKSSGGFLFYFGKVVEFLIPNLEQFNWKSQAVYAEVISFKTFAFAGMNAFFWFCFLLMASSLVFKRRDFV